MLVSRRSLVIEWGDCDPAGIVFYPRYFAYFDTSTWTLLTRAVGMSKAEMLRHYDIIGCPMVDTRARFLRPSTFGDEVTIETSVSELRRSSFDVRHRLLKADELTVEGFETRVWTGHDRTNLGRLKSRPIPAEVAAALAKAE